ncbi:Aste57867_17914 [Aphanomyces stellatus]|uniref:Aste57867_17914 protein n=1 Tax=Aphanomyces stellatus TaxID=120398 RepID=A0A485L9E5_9STRA|nr:hypothetical protein As57867_017853 [Aphanomyces stellatus]VFT94656.1 Aste57867_17914 [Aphanomyces stellatus]
MVPSSHVSTRDDDLEGISGYIVEINRMSGRNDARDRSFFHAQPGPTMLLESIAANLVNKFCSRFVKDFKKENLTISLSGEICLTQFELRTDELKELQLPVELKSFHVGKLRLNIPLAHLTTQSSQVELSDVNVLLGTPRDPKWDPDSLYVAEQTKIFIMQLLLDQVDAPASSSKGGDDTTHHHHVNKPPTGNAALGASILAIIQNCQVTIERIHIRFEDGLSGLDLERPTKYALGVTLASIRIHPATPCSVPGAQEKAMSLKHLSIYFKEDVMFDELSAEKRAQAFRAPFEGASANSEGSSSIPLLSPLSFDLTCRMSFQPVVQLSFNLTLPAIHLSLSHAHYLYLDCFLNHVDRFDRFSLYRRFRPTNVVGVDKKKPWKEWWRYAIIAVMMDLNDPVRAKPSWRNTLNLVLVGLQYTALRRQVTPFLIRQAVDSDHHFLQFREDFKGNASHSHAPFDRSLTLASDTIPKNVTHFGDGIFAGVYGLYRCFPRHGSSNATTTADTDIRQAEPVVENAEVKQLWHRQLCIDAAFRPIIAAKLRTLANRQMAHKDQRTVVATKSHNATKGTLTLTLMDGHAIAKPMLLFCKVKVGQKGTPHTGDMVQTDPPATADAKPDVLFAQTFEFRLNGTHNEDYVHVNVFDRWPMFSQFVGKFRLHLSTLTETSQSDQVVEIESADKKSKGMQLHVLSVFVPEGSKDHLYANSSAMMEALYPALYTTKPHMWHSWYTDLSKLSLRSLDAKVRVDQVHIAFVFPAATSRDTSTSSTKPTLDRLVVQFKDLRYNLQFVPSTLKHSAVVARLDMYHQAAAASGDKTHFFQAPRGDASHPFVQFEQVIEAKQPVKSKIRTADVEVVVDVPVLLRHVLYLVEKIPELTVFGALFNAPVYQAMMKYTAEDSTEAVTEVKKPEPVRKLDSSDALTSPRFLGSWKWTSKADVKAIDAPSSPPSTATVPVDVDKDRSDEFDAKVDLGAIYVALAGAPEEDKKGDLGAPPRVLEVMIPGMQLHIQGGKNRRTDVKSSTATLVKMDRDVQWVLGQLDKIAHVLQRQIKMDTLPFYEKPTLSSRHKAQRFEYEIHELERQLAHYRILIRQVVASPTQFQMESSDCDALRLMVREMQPKLIDASASTIANVQVDMFRLVLQQGVTVLKHNVRKGEPSWRVLWVQDKALCLAKPTDRQKAKVLPLSAIAGLATDKMTPALNRTGDEKELGKYVAIQVKDELKPISLEFHSTEIRNCVVAAIQTLVT